MSYIVSERPHHLPNAPKEGSHRYRTDYFLSTLLFYIKVHTATRWTIRHSLMLLWFADLMNVTEEVPIHRPHYIH